MNIADFCAELMGNCLRGAYSLILEQEQGQEQFQHQGGEGTRGMFTPAHRGLNSYNHFTQAIHLISLAARLLSYCVAHKGTHRNTSL